MITNLTMFVPRPAQNYLESDYRAIFELILISQMSTIAASELIIVIVIGPFTGEDCSFFVNVQWCFIEN